MASDETCDSVVGEELAVLSVGGNNSMSHNPENIWSAKTPMTWWNLVRQWWHGVMMMHNLIQVDTVDGQKWLGCYGCAWQ